MRSSTPLKPLGALQYGGEWASLRRMGHIQSASPEGQEGWMDPANRQVTTCHLVALLGAGPSSR